MLPPLLLLPPWLYIIIRLDQNLRTLTVARTKTQSSQHPRKVIRKDTRERKQCWSPLSYCACCDGCKPVKKERARIRERHWAAAAKDRGTQARHNSSIYKIDKLIKWLDSLRLGRPAKSISHFPTHFRNIIIILLLRCLTDWLAACLTACRYARRAVCYRHDNDPPSTPILCRSRSILPTDMIRIRGGSGGGI